MAPVATLLCLCPAGARADDILTISTAYADPGEINIGYRLMLGGDDNLNATCQARYRKAGES